MQEIYAIMHKTYAITQKIYAIIVKVDAIRCYPILFNFMLVTLSVKIFKFYSKNDRFM